MIMKFRTRLQPEPIFPDAMFAAKERVLHFVIGIVSPGLEDVR